jgi:hypothetical protein
MQIRLVLLCSKVDTSVSIYLTLATSGQYIEDDEPPAAGCLPATSASASLSGRSNPGRWTRRSGCPQRELHQGPHAADRAREHRVDGRASGSRRRTPDALAAASHRGRRGLDRRSCGISGFPRRAPFQLESRVRLGKQENRRVAVSVSFTTEQVSIPATYRLYLLENWASDAEGTIEQTYPKRFDS